MTTLVNTVRIVSDDIRMNFSCSKCATIAIKRGKVTDCTNFELPGGTIEALSISSTYKYLGVLEADGFQHKIKSDYIYYNIYISSDYRKF